jgi:hypothetical protein
MKSDWSITKTFNLEISLSIFLNQHISLGNFVIAYPCLSLLNVTKQNLVEANFKSMSCPLDKNVLGHKSLNGCAENICKYIKWGNDPLDCLLILFLYKFLVEYEQSRLVNLIPPSIDTLDVSQMCLLDSICLPLYLKLVSCRVKLLSMCWCKKIVFCTFPPSKMLSICIYLGSGEYCTVKSMEEFAN